MDKRREKELLITVEDRETLQCSPDQTLESAILPYLATLPYQELIVVLGQIQCIDGCINFSNGNCINFDAKMFVYTNCKLVSRNKVSNRPETVALQRQIRRYNLA